MFLKIVSSGFELPHMFQTNLFVLQMPAKVSASKLLEQQKMQDARALHKQSQSYQLVESDSEEEKTSKKSKKSKKRQLRAKKEDSESEEYVIKYQLFYPV